MRVLVVGVNGLIGSAVAARLAAQGHEVVGVTRRRRRRPNLLITTEVTIDVARAVDPATVGAGRAWCADGTAPTATMVAARCFVGTLRCPRARAQAAQGLIFTDPWYWDRTTPTGHSPRSISRRKAACQAIPSSGSTRHAPLSARPSGRSVAMRTARRWLRSHGAADRRQAHGQRQRARRRAQDHPVPLRGEEARRAKVPGTITSSSQPFRRKNPGGRSTMAMPAGAEIVVAVKRGVLVEQERQRVVYPDRREMLALLLIEIQTENEKAGGGHLVARRHDGVV